MFYNSASRSGAFLLPNAKNMLGCARRISSAQTFYIKEPNMSNPDVKKSLKQFVLSKIKLRDQKLSENTDQEGQLNVLTDYSLYFKGSVEALQAAGVDMEDLKVVQMVHTSNNTQLESLEQRIALDSLLDEAEEE